VVANNGEHGLGYCGLHKRFSEQLRTTAKPSSRLCTAEVRDSNPLGSTLMRTDTPRVVLANAVYFIETVARRYEPP